MTHELSEAAALAASIRTALAAIVAAWPDMLGATSSGVGGAHAKPGSKPPAPAAVLSLRRYVTERLASWCALVLDDFDDGATYIDGTDVPMMCAYLHRWADAIAGHEAALDAEAELRDDARRCKDIADQTRPRRFRGLPCVGHVTTELGERLPCTGTASAVLSERDDLLSVLVCDLDSTHVFGGDTWGAFASGVYTIAEASRLTRVPVSTITAWIGLGVIEPVVKARPMLIRVKDVTDTAMNRSA